MRCRRHLCLLRRKPCSLRPQRLSNYHQRLLPLQLQVLLSLLRRHQSPLIITHYHRRCPEPVPQNPLRPPLPTSTERSLQKQWLRHRFHPVASGKVKSPD
uniref:(northern house mosquito) hypothetical protein n=1 Tax=Culex pipiens TaxID=7175 RepID=A0A8D8DYR8_CULPI